MGEQPTQAEAPEDDASEGTSRRSFVKGTAAAGVAGFGLTQVDNVVTAQDQERGAASALIFTPQFLPEAEFELVSELDDPENFLGRRNELVPVLNPDEYDGFVIRYDLSIPYYTFLFVVEDADARVGDRFSLDRQASLISQERSIIHTRTRSA